MPEEYASCCAAAAASTPISAPFGPHGFNFAPFLCPENGYQGCWTAKANEESGNSAVGVDAAAARGGAAEASSRWPSFKRIGDRGRRFQVPFSSQGIFSRVDNWLLKRVRCAPHEELWEGLVSFAVATRSAAVSRWGVILGLRGSVCVFLAFQNSDLGSTVWGQCVLVQRMPF